MIKIKPESLHRADDPRLSKLAATLVGERLVSVRYAVPTGIGWENFAGLEHVHEVDMGVRLVTESGCALELAWATPGRDEGLLISFDSIDDATSNDLIDLVDVGGDEEWRNVLGEPVELVAIAFHSHSDDSSIRPWSFRIGASGGHWVTVALGEVRDGDLHYAPDNMVVIFNEDTARNYEIPGNSESAWGGVVATLGSG